MSRKSHFTLQPSDDQSPRSFSKQEFGRRLQELRLQQRPPWTQADLARKAEVGRDAISVYERGRSFPDTKNLEKLARAFGLRREELLPNILERAIDSEQPALSIRQASGHPDKVWVKVNQMTTLDQAIRIAEILKDKPE